MNFNELISFCDPLSVTGTPPDSLGDLCQDSRRVKPGDIFIAIKGLTTDGHDYIDMAIKNGASVIIAEKAVELTSNIAALVVKDSRKLIGPLAQKLADNPAEKLTVVGITGTNGKTTVATLIWQVLSSLGQPVSLLGTVEKRINKKAVNSVLTTADPIEIAADMKTMVEAGSKFLVMEVSSHALLQQRTNGIPFYVAIFTNLSHDHLDYHEDMENYASAKKLLFDSLDSSSWAITNVDDTRGEWITSDTEAKVLGLSFERHSTVQASIISADETGMLIDVEDLQLKTPLIGIFNAYNVVQALLACTALGFDGNHVADCMVSCSGAPGRLERVNDHLKMDSQPLVLVDYAHTPDALENVCQTLSEFKDESQILTVLFGCGGDRDKTKRPEMAKIAAKYGDRVIVTSDNPRSEDPQKIIQDIYTGFSNLTRVTSNPSRKEAIEQAIAEAVVNEIILIAGKGHETYQEINGERIHFDDREIALDALNSRNWKTKSNGVG